MKPYKGILLDLDHTLYDYELCHQPALKKTLDWVVSVTSVPLSEVQRHYGLARKQTNLRLDKTASSHNRLLYFQGLFERLGESPIPRAFEAYNRYWDCFLELMCFRDGVIPFLDRFQGQICLLTDLTAHIQYRKIEQLGLGRWVDKLVTSEEIGQEKPSEKMFLAGLEKLGMPPSEVCMIGDNHPKDCLGAARQGISSVWLNTGNTEPEAHPLITSVQSFSQLNQTL